MYHRNQLKQRWRPFPQLFNSTFHAGVIQNVTVCLHCESCVDLPIPPQLPPPSLPSSSTATATLHHRPFLVSFHFHFHCHCHCRCCCCCHCRCRCCCRCRCHCRCRCRCHCRCRHCHGKFFCSLPRQRRPICQWWQVPPPCQYLQSCLCHGWGAPSLPILGQVPLPHQCPSWGGMALWLLVAVAVVVCCCCCHCWHHCLHVSCCHCLSTNVAHFLVFCIFSCTQKLVNVDDAYVAGQNVMGRANQRLGKLLPGLPKDRRFHAFFGVSAQVSTGAWNMMEDQNVSPPPISSSFIFCGHLHLCEHILQTTPLSHVCWGEWPQDNKRVCVAIHPVTFCVEQNSGKPFVWLFLVDDSFWLNWYVFQSFALRFNLITGRWEMSAMTISFWLTEPAFETNWAIWRIFGASSSKKVVFGTRWVCASWQETFAGGAGLMPQVSGMTIWFPKTVYYWCWSLERGVRRIGTGFHPSWSSL